MPTPCLNSHSSLNSQQGVSNSTLCSTNSLESQALLGIWQLQSGPNSSLTIPGQGMVTQENGKAQGEQEQEITHLCTTGNIENQENKAPYPITSITAPGNKKIQHEQQCLTGIVPELESARQQKGQPSLHGQRSKHKDFTDSTSSVLGRTQQVQPVLQGNHTLDRDRERDRGDTSKTFMNFRVISPYKNMGGQDLLSR